MYLEVDSLAAATIHLIFAVIVFVINVIQFAAVGFTAEDRQPRAARKRRAREPKRPPRDPLAPRPPGAPPGRADPRHARRAAAAAQTPVGPSRTAYLCQCTPGSVKTSLSTAMAGELRLNICILNLSTPSRDVRSSNGLPQPPHHGRLTQTVAANRTGSSSS